MTAEAPEVTPEQPDVQPEAETVEAVSAQDEIERLDPPSQEVKLSSGTVVVVQPLKARQFFKLLRIITRGGANVLHTMRLSSAMPQEEFMQNLLALVIFAIPEAEDETMEFVQSMVLPQGFEKLTEHKARAEALSALAFELDNPELEDMLEIVNVIIKREAQDLQALGKRLSGLMGVAEKTGQLPKTEKSS